MLEIIAIVMLAKSIGKICRAKNLKPGWYQFLAVFLWIFLEITFLLIGFIVVGEGVGAYVFAICGAALGGIIAYQIASAPLKRKALVNWLDACSHFLVCF